VWIVLRGARVQALDREPHLFTVTHIVRSSKFMWWKTASSRERPSRATARRSSGLSLALPAPINEWPRGLDAMHIEEPACFGEAGKNSASPIGPACTKAEPIPKLTRLRRFQDVCSPLPIRVRIGMPVTMALPIVPFDVDRRVVRTRPPPPLSARRRPRGLRPSGNGCECPTPSLQPSAPTVTCPIAPPDYRTCSLGSARAPSVRSSFAYSCSSALRREARLHVS
jgi:hypothetical protein